MVIVNGQEFADVSVTAVGKEIRNKHRQSLAFKLNATYNQAVSAFTDGATIIIRIDEPAKDEFGNPILNDDETPQTVKKDYDKSEYCVSGDVVDHRDGTITVYMGKKTDAEVLEEENAALLLELIGG